MLLATLCFRAVLFRMVPKHRKQRIEGSSSFRAVLFRMVPKHDIDYGDSKRSFRAVLFRMVPKLNAAGRKLRITF